MLVNLNARPLLKAITSNWLGGCGLLLCCLLYEHRSTDSLAQEATGRVGYQLSVPMPLTPSVDIKLRQQIQRIVDQPGAPDRPIVVLRFVASPKAANVDQAKLTSIGRGSEFETCLGLARWLQGPIGVRARTVAYCSQSLEGHAVLAALACEELAMTSLSEIGKAGIDEAATDEVVLNGYLGIAKRRNTFPEAAIRSMLDRTANLYRVELVGEQSKFVNADELDKLKAKGDVLSESQIGIADQMASFTGQAARKEQWTSFVVNDETQLQNALGIQQWKSLKRQTADGPIHPALLEIRGAIHSVAVNRWLRVLDETTRDDRVNLVLFHVHSPGGNLDESLRLASAIAELDGQRFQKIAWVDGLARGDAALVALACDQIYVTPLAIMGGPGEASIGADDVRDRNEEWLGLAERTERRASDFYNWLSPDLALHEFTNPQGQVELGNEELFSRRPDFKQWTQGKRVAFPNGLTAEAAIERGVISGLEASLADVGKEFGIEKLPEPKRVTQLEQWIRNLADQEWLATLLLTMAIALFTNELTTPGLGIAGFLSMVCMLFFFWMRFLNGTVEWLELLLCLGGLLAIGLELFVLPGFGIFGFGGFLMLIAGIILASQTFIVPTNDYQWNKLATSTGQIAIALMAFLGTLYLLRNQLEHLPFVRLLKLDPPVKAQTSRPSSFDHLVGKRGVVTARCAPIGTALIEDQFREVHARDQMIEPGTPIVVSEVRGQAVFVQSAT
jgi:membrane-bound serine protease (ClpP class)